MATNRVANDDKGQSIGLADVIACTGSVTLPVGYHDSHSPSLLITRSSRTNKGRLCGDHGHPSVTLYQRLNRLSDFYETRYRRSLEKAVQRGNQSHTLPEAINVFLPVLSIFLDRFW